MELPRLSYDALQILLSELDENVPSVISKSPYSISSGFHTSVSFNLEFECACAYSHSL